MPFIVTVTWGHLGRKPGREPTHAEACAEVKRILTESKG
jgi:hypothetical protein